VRVGYPDAAAEGKIVELNRREERGAAPAAASSADAPVPTDPPAPLVSQDVIFAARAEVHAVTVGEAVAKYIVALIQATREPAAFDKTLAGWIQVGASPRGTIGLDRVSRAYAWLRGRDHVTPADVQAIAHDVLRHRLVLSYDALAQGVTPDQAIDTLVAKVAVA